MDPQEYELMFRVELTHWWYRGMTTITRTILQRRVLTGGALKVLDAGCGTGGAMTTNLAGLGSVTGVDISASALNFCQSRGLAALTQASVDRLPFAGASFNLVTSFDVIYERSVKNDLNAVKEFARLLVPGGFLLLRLPAYDWLRGHHDKVVHTARRYTTGRVAELLREAGLSVRVLSYANTFLFPLALVKRLSDRLRPARPEQSDLTLPLGPFNTIFTAILSWEAPLVARSSLPYGLSVFALAQKPQ